MATSTVPFSVSNSYWHATCTRQIITSFLSGRDQRIFLRDTSKGRVGHPDIEYYVEGECHSSRTDIRLVWEKKDLAICWGSIIGG